MRGLGQGPVDSGGGMTGHGTDRHCQQMHRSKLSFRETLPSGSSSVEGEGGSVEEGKGKPGFL